MLEIYYKKPEKIVIKHLTNMVQCLETDHENRKITGNSENLSVRERMRIRVEPGDELG
jgi:hypothetical protein